MEQQEELLNELKKQIKELKKALPHFSDEERVSMITQATNESEDVPQEKKAEIIKLLSQIK